MIKVGIRGTLLWGSSRAKWEARGEEPLDASVAAVLRVLEVRRAASA